MYMVGWSKQEISIQPKGYAMFGYGMWTHRADKKRTALFARTFSIRDVNEVQPILICCLDFGCITHAMRSGVVEVLKQKLTERFDEQQLVLMATHTHSGPGGCAYEALYNMPTPGFVPEHLNAVVEAVVKSVLLAIETEQKTEIRYSTGQFDENTPVAWNRALKSYNRNPDVVQRDIHETHLALNREMQLLGFYRQQQLCGLISLFGVHATCLGNKLNAYDGDNKGYAATFTEQYLAAQGIDQPVAIFAQASAGDVSPHFHGKNQDAVRNKIQGEAEYQYAQQNGRYQSDLAIQALSSSSQTLEGKLDAVLSYVDLSQVEIPTEFSKGIKNAKTSAACHGVAFFGGTPVDGKGAAKPITMAMSLLSKQVRKKRLANPNAPDYDKYHALYASQFPKDIILESPDNQLLGKGLDVQPSFLDPLIREMNRQVKAGAIQHSPLVPSVVPLQILKLGQLLLICCPGEITTTSAQRVIQTVYQSVQGNLSTNKVWLVSYCNDYMGYITTNEEYQQQAYEGGHTLYGQWTLAAVQYKFQGLATQINLEKALRSDDQSTRPAQIPQYEIDQRTNFGSLKTAVR
ncbi:neutral/alkaline non-lysosomal ceramidase N-terminal domain-containing protein [Acinetobacter piscicola]|uniref:neutral/alkaline non-lysosomal ceramidase N-terminal domain-containing protein n=1 Tax=Acinetobacter piscicola TaxID=2006115 RepID=UPI000B7CB7BE|nr:neutral/alkaline non-lysosomal ceramidase N-terminal domain-containing protein [Acinetobacter piscicola]